MRNQVKLVLAATAAMFVSASAVSGSEKSQRYDLQMEIKDGGATIAKPHLVVEAGQQAQIEIGQPDAPIYKISFLMTPQSNNLVAVASSIRISDLNGQSRMAEPVLLVGLGEPSRIAFGDQRKNEPIFEMNFAVNGASVD